MNSAAIAPRSRVSSKVGPNKTQRRKLFDIHSWLGFNLALFMALVVGTGTFAVIADEIDWLIHPEMRAQSEGEPLSWGALERAVRESAPDDILTMLSVHEGSYFNYRALMYTPEGRAYYRYVDPVTGEVTGTTSSLTVQRFLRDLHRYLFMPAAIGLPLVTTMAIVLVISLYTGLKTVRNWRTVALRLRLNRGARVAMGDFHKAAGLWSIWFFLLIVATSFWYFAELGYAAGGGRFEPSRPGVSAERLASLGTVQRDVDADALVAAATAALPGLRTEEIQFAGSPRQAATVLGRLDDPLVRKRANRVFIDPVDGSVIHAQRSSEIGWVAYLNEIADPLHFGSFGHLVTKLIWFVFGLMMFSLTLTGVWLTWKRLKSRTMTAMQLGTLPLLLIVTYVGYNYVARRVDDRGLENVLRAPIVEMPLMDVALEVERSPTDVPTGAVRVRATSDHGRIHLSGVAVALPGEEKPLLMRPRVQGTHATLDGRLPIELLSAAHLDAELRFANGTAMPLRFSLSPAIARVD